MPLKGVRVQVPPEVPILKNDGFGVIAQLGERLFCTQEVSGSIPLSSTIFLIKYKVYLIEDIYGSVAQLARAIGSYPIGRGFESLRSHQIVFTDP